MNGSNVFKVDTNQMELLEVMLDTSLQLVPGCLYSSYKEIEKKFSNKEISLQRYLYELYNLRDQFIILYYGGLGHRN